jgi:hypothetical protein
MFAVAAGVGPLNSIIVCILFIFGLFRDLLHQSPDACQEQSPPNDGVATIWVQPGARQLMPGWQHTRIALWYGTRADCRCTMRSLIHLTRRAA